jgi:subtilase family serine protease
LFAAAAALAFAPLGAAQGAVPFPTAQASKATDLGRTSGVEGDVVLSVTVALKLRNAEEAHELLQSVSTPGSASFRQFLSTEQFREKFGPSAETIESVSASLRSYGLKVEPATTTTLRATGTVSQLERAFQTTLHSFSVAGTGGRPGYSFHAPTAALTIPAEAAASVHGVLGLDTRPRFSPHLQKSLHQTAAGARITPAHSTTGNSFGTLTVADYASIYNVTPLYGAGITGKGRTIGIVTLAAFTPSDAYAYWSAVGLTVDANRIKVVNIDGGPGAPNDYAGSGETTLDVEQSGGVAPGAKIIVYQAPNTNQAFVDAFAMAIDANIADTMSTSWGSWEWFDNGMNSPVVDPYSGKPIGEIGAMHELFLQAALQGQSLFAASGDAGAYDPNDGADGNGNSLLPPNYSLTLGVDSPASDPYITAAGGTTLPGKQVYLVSGLPDYIVNLKQEYVWSWDYLVNLCAEIGYTPLACGIFPVGSGGGVSIRFVTPFYQKGLAGVQTSEPDQSFVDELTIPPQTLYDLPANFAGRNVPDLSANADPDTGYSIYYTSSISGFGILTFYGGTSFVAPQLNGTTSLLNQLMHGRIGLLNVPAYAAAKSGGYSGPFPGLRAIQKGNNDFYMGSNGYNPAAGLGVLNVGNFAEMLGTSWK